MRPLADFSKLESNPARGDRFEGTTRIIQPKHLSDFVLDTGTIGLGKFTVNPSELTGPVRIGFPITASCNVYCMFAVTKPIHGDLVSTALLEFGDSFVIVLNPAEFLNRVVCAATCAGLSSLQTGLVHYYDADLYSGETGRFQKPSKFAYQNEFRIVVEPGSDKPRELFAGSLRDITSEVLPSAEANHCCDFSPRSAREAGISC